ncbi:MAG: hypothetical protein ABEJ56_06810 [Candidatus Nanohaloarchaea archaeon]
MDSLLNREVGVIVGIVLAIIVLLLTVVFVKGGYKQGTGYIFGSENSKGVVGCNPVKDKNCPEQSNSFFRHELIEVTAVWMARR